MGVQEAKFQQNLRKRPKDLLM